MEIKEIERFLFESGWFREEIYNKIHIFWHPLTDTYISVLPSTELALGDCRSPDPKTTVKVTRHPYPNEHRSRVLWLFPQSLDHLKDWMRANDIPPLKKNKLKMTYGEFRLVRV